MKQVLSSRLLQILHGGSARVLVAISLGRSSLFPHRAADNLKPASAALPLSRMLREGDSSHSFLYLERPWPTRLKTRPTIYSGSSSSDVPMKKITENAALHPNEDPRAVIPGHSRSRSPNRAWSSSRLDACSCFHSGRTLFACGFRLRPLRPRPARPLSRPWPHAVSSCVSPPFPRVLAVPPSSRDISCRS
jgi:hypothetical protein